MGGHHAGEARAYLFYWKVLSESPLILGWCILIMQRKSRLFQGFHFSKTWSIEITAVLMLENAFIIGIPNLSYILTNPLVE
jgi:hypothetical protein